MLRGHAHRLLTTTSKHRVTRVRGLLEEEKRNPLKDRFGAESSMVGQGLSIVVASCSVCAYNLSVLHYTSLHED